MGDPNNKAEIEHEVRAAVRDILLGSEGQMLMERVAEEAALHAITDFMLKIGMDTTSPQSIIALQMDMQHLRWWNKFVNSATMKLAMALGMVVVSGGFIAVAARSKEFLQWIFLMG